MARFYDWNNQASAVGPLSEARRSLSNEAVYEVVVQMFMGKMEKHYKGGTYTHYSLVESIHTPKGPRQSTLCSLGDLKSKPTREWLLLSQIAVTALMRMENGATPANRQGLLRGA